MRTLLASALIGAAALGTGVVIADPGPNGSNNFGMCTAYFAGNDRARENKRNAPPFQQLEQLAEDAYEGDSEDPIEQKVAEWCAANAPHPSGNGNPGGNGGNPGGGNPGGNPTGNGGGRP